MIRFVSKKYYDILNCQLYIYRFRNKKAIDYIKNNYNFYYGDDLLDSYQKILDILQGSDDFD